MRGGATAPSLQPAAVLRLLGPLSRTPKTSAAYLGVNSTTCICEALFGAAGALAQTPYVVPYIIKQTSLEWAFLLRHSGGLILMVPEHIVLFTSREHDFPGRDLFS